MEFNQGERKIIGATISILKMASIERGVVNAAGQRRKKKQLRSRFGEYGTDRAKSLYPAYIYYYSIHETHSSPFHVASIKHFGQGCDNQKDGWLSGRGSRDCEVLGVDQSNGNSERYSIP